MSPLRTAENQKQKTVHMTGGMYITYYILIPEYVNPLWVCFSGCLTYNDRTVPCTRLLCCHPVYFSGSHGSEVVMMFLTVLFVCLADPLPGKLCRMTHGCLPVQVARLLATEAAAAPQSSPSFVCPSSSSSFGEGKIGEMGDSFCRTNWFSVVIQWKMFC